MAVNLPYDSQDAGIPAQWSDTINPADKDLFSGDIPAKMTQDLTFATNQTIEARTVVGLNASNQVVPALYDADPEVAIKPIGVTVHKVVTPSSGGGTKGGAVYRHGCLNPDALIWPASFDNDTKKAGAFEGSPSPTNIILRKVRKGGTL